ncbi:hypothetical protein Bca4012_100340 [Brassica carinata]
MTEEHNKRFTFRFQLIHRERERATKRERIVVSSTSHRERGTTEREYRRFLAEPRRGSIAFRRGTTERETIALLGDEDGEFSREVSRETKQTEHTLLLSPLLWPTRVLKRRSPSSPN